MSRAALAARGSSLSVRSSALACIFVVALASSCSLTRTSVDDCKNNADCRGAFGATKICGSDGLCSPVVVNPRCTTTFPADVLTRPESYPNAILLGAIMDRSVETQRARENAIRLAATQVNEEKGLDGRLFGIVFCDIAENATYDSLKRTDAAIATSKFLADSLGVPVIVGPSSSTDALAVLVALKDLDTLIISPSATSPALTAADTKIPNDKIPGLLWRTAPPDTLQGAAIVRHLGTAFPSVKSVALIQEKGPYGDALAQVFTDGFAKAGGTVTPFPFGSSSERDAAVVAAGNTPAPTVLFISSQTPDAIAFLNAAGSLGGYATKNLFLTDSAANKDVLTGAAAASAVFPRIVGSRPAVPAGPTFELFKASFNAAFRQDPSTFSFVPHAYDAAWLGFYGTARALRRDVGLSGVAVGRGLRKVSDGTPEIAVTPANWKKVADTLGAGGSVNLVGASGSLDFDATTEETTGLVDIWKVSTDAKSIQTVTTIDPR